MLTAAGPDEVLVALDVAAVEEAVPLAEPVAADETIEVIVVLILLTVDEDASA